jgi:hypothetical protein
MQTTAAILTLLWLLSLAFATRVAAQDPRLEARVPDPPRSEIDAILDSARAAGLPTEPLVDRALEGVSKGAGGDRVLAAVHRLHAELAAARDAIGPESSEAEIVAAASALRAGATPEDLTHLRQLRPDQSLTVAAAVLADLVAVGVPLDTAVAAVVALAQQAADAEYIAFRKNVERDISLGASPVTALGVRLGAVADLFEGSRTPVSRPRKP